MQTKGSASIHVHAHIHVHVYILHVHVGSTQAHTGMYSKLKCMPFIRPGSLASKTYFLSGFGGVRRERQLARLRPTHKEGSGWNSPLSPLSPSPLSHPLPSLTFSPLSPSPLSHPLPSLTLSPLSPSPLSHPLPSLTFSPERVKWHMLIMCSTRHLWTRQNLSNPFWLLFISFSISSTDDIIASTSCTNRHTYTVTTQHSELYRELENPNPSLMS